MTAATIMVLVTACAVGADVPAPASEPTTASTTIPDGQWFGTLQSRPEHAAEDRAAGMRLATIEPTWDG
jgi:hypothetical protein